MDRFYQSLTEQVETKDLQLTATTALFIASKNIEVEPLSLTTCVKTLCFSKYSKRQFLTKEKAIRLATIYECDVPTLLDFVMFFAMHLQSKFPSDLLTRISTLAQ